MTQDEPKEFELKSEKSAGLEQQSELQKRLNRPREYKSFNEFRGKKKFISRGGAIFIALTAVLTFIVLVADSRPPTMQTPAGYRGGQQEEFPESWVPFDLLEQLTDSGLIDSVLGSGSKEGYTFHAFWDGEDPDNWWFIGRPRSPETGRRQFYVDPSGVIRVEEDATPTAESPTLGKR